MRVEEWTYGGGRVPCPFIVTVLQDGIDYATRYSKHLGSLPFHERIWRCLAVSTGEETWSSIEISFCQGRAHGVR